MNQPAENTVENQELPEEQTSSAPSEEELFAEAFAERFGDTPEEGENLPKPEEEEEESMQGRASDDDGGEVVEGTSTSGEESESVSAPNEAEGQPVGGEQAASQPDDNKLELPDGSSIDRPKWWGDMPKEVQEHFDQTTRELAQLNYQYSAVHGRLAPVQQENTRLRAQLETLQAQLASAQPASGAGAGGQSQPNATPDQDLQQSKEFAEFAEAFPDEARAIEAMVGAKTTELAAMKQELAQLKSGLTSIQQGETQRSREAELNRLTEAHPDWAAVRNSEQFNHWLNVQPESVKALVNSSRADDCIWALDAYKQAVYLSNLQNQPEPTPVDPAAARAQATRQRLQQTPPSPAPRPSGVSAARGNPLAGVSDEDLFAAEVERRTRAQR